MKENLMKHGFKPILIKIMVVLTFILGLYLCKTTVGNSSFRFELNSHQWKSTPSCFDNFPPMLHGELMHESGALDPHHKEL